MGNNIAIPYSSYINGGVRDGVELVLTGTPKPNADRFSINFSSAPKVEQGDVVFHFNPRFNQGCVVRNHRQAGAWGAEETAGGMPLRRGQFFTMQVQVRKQGFKVLVNKKHFCDFTCRLSLATVQFLTIGGDVTVHSIHLKEERASPSAVPWSSFIPGGVCDGVDVVIVGTPNPSCDRFSVNFGAGQTQEQGDLPFHFNPRFSQGCVVRNHRQGSVWGPTEETAGGMPFVRGQTFTMNLMVQNHGYQVLVNGGHFCNFTHRLAKEAVQFLHIKGDVHVASVEFRRQSVQMAYPGAATPAPINYPHAGTSPNPVYNPAVPITMPIQGGFYPGKIIHITGLPHIGASRFHVDLVCGFSQFSDLALHFDVRFNYCNDRNLVVRTNRQGGQYGVEERHQPYFPFVHNANFEMMFLCEPHCIKVAVNNQHFIEFNHRVQPLNRVDHLQINGDVTVNQIRFQ